LDQVIEALKNPSGEHMAIYGYLGVAVLLLAGLVYMVMQQLSPK